MQVFRRTQTLVGLMMLISREEYPIAVLHCRCAHGGEAARNPGVRGVVERKRVGAVEPSSVQDLLSHRNESGIAKLGELDRGRHRMSLSKAT